MLGNSADEAEADIARPRTTRPPPPPTYLYSDDSHYHGRNIDYAVADVLHDGTNHFFRRYTPSSPFYSHDASPRSYQPGEQEQEDELDFIDIVSEISLAYKRGAYMTMKDLAVDDVHALGQRPASVITLSSPTQPLPLYPTPVGQGREHVIVKRLGVDTSMHHSEIQQFITELRVLDHLHDSPFIVNMRGLGWLNEWHNGVPSPRPCLLLEPASGNMKDMIKAKAIPSCLLEWRAQLGLFAQLTAGLSALHRSRIAHRDINLENVLLYRTWDAGVDGFSYTILYLTALCV